MHIILESEKIGVTLSFLSELGDSFEILEASTSPRGIFSVIEVKSHAFDANAFVAEARLKNTVSQAVVVPSLDPVTLEHYLGKFSSNKSLNNIFCLECSSQVLTLVLVDQLLRRGMQIHDLRISRHKEAPCFIMGSSNENFQIADFSMDAYQFMKDPTVSFKNCHLLFLEKTNSSLLNLLDL
jgi:hypothetical protein